MTEVRNLEPLMAHDEWGACSSPDKPGTSHPTPSASSSSSSPAEYPGRTTNPSDEPRTTLNFLMQLYHAFDGKITKEVRKQIVESFCAHVIELCTSTSEATTTNNESILNGLGEFTCPLCFGILREPLTMICGHTYCKKCINKEDEKVQEEVTQCKLCPAKFTSAQIRDTRPNVVLMDLLNKCFPSADSLFSLRNKGKELFSTKDYEAAVQKFTQAIDLCK